MISQNIKKQIIDQPNIVEVVGEVVKLTKKGSSYFGLCPFHNDNNPSMSVNNEKKMFNCFSCNTKGNVIYFFSRFNNIKKGNPGKIVEKELPTLQEVNSIKNRKILNDAKSLIGEGNLDEYIKIIENESEYDGLELSAALLKMMREK